MRTGTRWGRAVVAMVGGFAATAALGFGMASQVFAGADGSIRIQSAGMDFTSQRIIATDVGFGMTPVTTVSSTGATSTKPVLRAGFAVATMQGLCLSKTESLPIIGAVVLKLQIPTTSTVSARNASFDLTEMRGVGSTGIELRGSAQIGQATADLTSVPGAKPYEANPLAAPTANGGYGWTGIDASSGDLQNVRGTLWQAQITGDIALPALRIQVGSSVTAC